MVEEKLVIEQLQPDHVTILINFVFPDSKPSFLLVFTEKADTSQQKQEKTNEFSKGFPVENQSTPKFEEIIDMGT